MHSERTHGRYSPSQADRFFECPASVKMLAKVPPRPSSVYAVRGTWAHEVIEHAIRSNIQDATEAVSSHDVHFATDFDRGDIAAIDTALDYIYEKRDELDLTYGDAVLCAETKIEFNFADGEADGHCDVFIYSRIGKLCYVIDYKHGAGVTKSVKGNRQVKQYGAGLAFGKNSPLAGLPDVMEWTFVMVIIQPRAFHIEGPIREDTLSAYDLRDYMIKLQDKIAECESDAAPLIAGEEQCYFCDARFNCPAYDKKALTVASETFSSVRDVSAPGLPDPRQFDAARLSYISTLLPMLKDWIKTFESYRDEQVLAGVQVAGWKVVETQARREWWGDPMTQVKSLASLIGCKPEDLYEMKRKGIIETEDMVVDAFTSRVGRGKKKQAAEDARQLFAYYTTKESTGKYTVAPVDDRRPAVDRSKIAFAGVSGLLPPPQQ